MYTLLAGKSVFTTLYRLFLWKVKICLVQTQLVQAVTTFFLLNYSNESLSGVAILLFFKS